MAKTRSWLFTTLHRAFLGSRRRLIRFPHLELEQAADELPEAPPELEGSVDGGTSKNAGSQGPRTNR